MQWTGKIVGGAIGMVFGPIGAAVGAFLGHQYDVRAEHAAALGGPRASVLQIGEEFFRATFLVMGHIAKADGRVTQREIDAARATMQSLRLTAAQTREAMELFTAGKQSDFDLDATIASLRQTCGGHPALTGMFLEIQMRAAISGEEAGAPLQPTVKARLGRVAGILGVPQAHVEQLEAALRYYGRRPAGATQASTSERLATAYRSLEIEPAATDAEVTTAYRRLMSRHHPDKLKANGLPDSMLEHAKQRTQQVREAYEYIKERRGMA